MLVSLISDIIVIHLSFEKLSFTFLHHDIIIIRRNTFIMHLRREFGRVIVQMHLYSGWRIFQGILVFIFWDSKFSYTISLTVFPLLLHKIFYLKFESHDFDIILPRLNFNFLPFLILFINLLSRLLCQSDHPIKFKINQIILYYLITIN